MAQNNQKITAAKILLLQFGAFTFSLSNVCSKYASRYEFLSCKFIILYLGSLCVLFVYALLWQQLLKQVPLIVAYSNRLMSMVWGILWGLVLFQEPVSIQNIIGTAIIIYGLYTMGKAEI